MEGPDNDLWGFLVLQWVPLVLVCWPGLRTDQLQEKLLSCSVLRNVKGRLVVELTGVRRPVCSSQVRHVAPRSIPGICWRLPRWGRAAGNRLSHPQRIRSGDVGAALCRYRGGGYVMGIHLHDAGLQGMTRLDYTVRCFLRDRLCNSIHPTGY